jgi:pimeloyl-ACP methyl ester carboxylesterase
MGSGGATTSGETTGADGTVSSGGSVATGGTTGNGGVTGTDSSTGTGGKIGSGGATSMGGAGNTGGTKGMGGTTSDSGGSIVASGGSITGGSSGGVSTTSTGGAGAGGSTPKGGTVLCARCGSAGALGTGGSGTGGSSGSSAAVPSAGCGKTPTLKNSPSATANQNTISGSRQFLIRWPSNYDNTHPYRLILDFHGAGGNDTDLAPSYFGLFDLSYDSTIFIAPSANGGTWNATADLTLVDDILTAVEADLCIDTSRIMLEGFSQGGAMVATLACSRPGVFRAAVGHSRGGLTAPTTCQPIPYLGSLGLSNISGNSQATQTDLFAKGNGCAITTLPTAATGSHICSNYSGCQAGEPVIWCSYDGGDTPSPNDSGHSTSWMPQVVWYFLSQF